MWDKSQSHTPPWLSIGPLPGSQHVGCASQNSNTNPKIGGNSSLYALSLIFSSILKGPAPRGMSLDFLKSRNLSFLKCNHTKSPGSNLSSFLPLLPASL